MEAELIRLLSTLNSTTDTNAVQLATKTLLEINSNPESFILYSNILETQQSPYIYNHCLITLYGFISRLGTECFGGAIPDLLMRICALIESPALPLQTKLYGCDLMGKISQTTLDIGLSQIIQHLQENPQNIIFVFRILQHAYISLPDYDDYTLPLIAAFQNSIVSGSDDCKKCAIDFFRDFIFNVDKPEVLNSQELFAIIFDQLRASVEARNQQFVGKYVSLITDFYDMHFSPFFHEQFLVPFLDYALETMNNAEIPTAIRVLVHGLLPQGHDDDFDLIPESHINNLILTSIMLSYQVCCEMGEKTDEFSDDYMFNSAFLMIFHYQIPNAKAIFGIFIEILQKLFSEGNPFAIRVFLYTTSILVDGFPMYFYGIKENLIEVIKNSFECGDPLIIQNANELIVSLIQLNPFILKPVFNDISQFFLSGIQTFPSFLTYLNEYLMYLPIVPENLEGIVQYSMGLFTSSEAFESRYMALSILNNSLRLFRPNDESLLSMLEFDKMMGDVENQEMLFELLKTFVKVFPVSIQSNLEGFLNFLNTYKSEDVDYSLDSSRFSCLIEIIKYFPESAAQFVPIIQQIIEYGSKAINSKPDRSGDDAEELDQSYKSMKHYYYLLLATSMRYFQLNQEIVDTYLKERENAWQLISIIANITDIDYAIKNYHPNFNNMTKLISLKGLGTSYEGICEELLAFLMNEIYDDSIFNLINIIIKRGRQIPNEIVQILAQLAENGDFYQIGRVFQSLAYVSVFIANDQIPTIYEQLFNLLELEDQSQKLYALKGINLILNYFPTGLTHTELVFEKAQGILADPFASFDLITEAVVSCFLCLDYNCDLAKAKEYFALLSFESTLNKMTFANEEIFIVLSKAACKFYQEDQANFFEEFLNVALHALSSDTLIWLQIDGAFRDFMKSVVAQLESEVVINNYRHNEKRIKLFHENMSS